MNFSNRWVQLAAGITGMVAVANFQYSWTLFVPPLKDRTASQGKSRMPFSFLSSRRLGWCPSKGIWRNDSALGSY